jgi:hypothetical protein
MANGFQVHPGGVPPDVQVFLDRLNAIPVNLKNKIDILIKRLGDIVAIREFGERWYDLHEDERNIPGFKEMFENIYMNEELISRRIRAAQDTLDEIANEFQHNDEYEDIVNTMCNHVQILENARNYVGHLINANVIAP